MPQLHLAPTQETADAIRRQAAKAGVSVNALLLPYLNAIAEGRLTMEPNHVPPPQREISRAAWQLPGVP